MAMDLKSLRYLVTLAQRRSFARAAEELGITQSALSRSIQMLEERFSVRLFDRGRSGATPTAAGERIVDRAQALLANASDLERHFREESAGKSGTLSFGMAHVPARALLAASLAETMKDSPMLRHNVTIRGVESLWPLLVSGKLEFLVVPTRIVPDTPPVRIEPLGRFPVSLVVRHDHPLLVNFGSGPRFPFISSSESFTTRIAPGEVLAEIDGILQIVEDFDALSELTKATDAIWLTSAFAVSDQLSSGELCELPSYVGSAGRFFDVAILSLDWCSQSPAARQMKQALRKNFNLLSRAHAEVRDRAMGNRP